jgi:glucosyl-dolichyl phosphate glucuronosyltransferase
VAEYLITVVVPTFNRAAFLKRTLRSLLRQNAHHADYEIVVVDNNCTDQTAEVVAAEGGTSAPVRYVFESRQGLSYAKNAGVDAARGRIVAYIDDDAIAPCNWVKALSRGFDRGSVPTDVVGGPIVPLFIGRRPPWYKESYDTHTWGSEPRLLNRGECFYGSNVAFRRDLLIQVGGFATELGQRGLSLGVGEDNEIFERLWAQTGNLVAYYSPEAEVLHAIPDARASYAYKIKRGFAAGQSAARAMGRTPTGTWAAEGLRAAYMSARSAGWAMRQLPDFDLYQNWLVECGAPVARRVGFLVGLSGASVSATRSH